MAKNRSKKLAEEAEDTLSAKTPKLKIKTKDLLSSGSTLINLACTNTSRGAFAKGRYYFFVGDSESGKTWICLNFFAEASINPAFDKYRLIYDAPEDGALMDFDHYYGKAAAKRVEPPRTAEDGEPIYSHTVEEFYDNIGDALDDGTPFVYVLDSMDALSSASEIDKMKQQKKARRKGTEVSGSYGDGKARINSQNLRGVVSRLKQSGSILIIICQSRDNIGTMSMEKKTRSGGHAIKFYATLEMWTSVAGQLKKTVKKKPRQIGIITEIRVKKNRVTGKKRRVQVPIYHSYGVDDIGSCIDWLIAEGHWSKSGTNVRASEFEFKGPREALIKKIEADGLERELQMTVASVWKQLDAECAVKRKPRYA